MTDGLEARIGVRRPDGFALDIELSIPAGQTVGLLGPNGAGKSTTVSALAGLLPIDSGRIELAGAVLDDPDRGVLLPPENRRIGVVFQDALLFPHLSILENVAFGARSRGSSAEQARDGAREWLQRLGMAGFKERKPQEISGGQAQRVALARALATEPRLLLMDEPLSALDVRSRSELREFLAEHLAAFPGPRLLITHDPAEAFELADVIHIIENGRVTQKGSAEDIRMRPGSQYAAEVGGTNLFHGVASGGSVDVGSIRLATAYPEFDGPVRVSIRPSAVSVHRERPGGSPRNRWRTILERVEDDGSRVRLLTGAPLPMRVEVTPGACRELELEPGVEVWIAVKATEIGVEARE